MKPTYFNQPAADLDDHQLKEMIAAGTVPETCLWGGLLVQHVAQEMKDDPCAWCPCPKRQVCGGRPQKHNLGVTQKPAIPERRISDDEAGARKLQRAGWIRTLRGWMKGDG